MKRRDFIALICCAAAWPHAARGQTIASLPRVGYLFSFNRPEGEHLWEACQRGLRELGYVEQRNIMLEPRWAEGGHEQLPVLAADLVKLKVDAIVAAATPASRAAKAATGTIPIVIVAVGDPVRAGLVASLARPGGNITGLSLLTPELSGKRLELLSEIRPGLSQVTVLMNPENPVSAIFWEETRANAQKLKIELQRLEASGLAEVESALGDRPVSSRDAMIVFDDPVLWSFRNRIVALTAERRIPTMFGYRDFVDQGGLMSYGPDRIDQYRRTAIFVDKILKGAKPGDLPVEQPTRFELVLNMRTARALGLDVPPTLIARADEVIE